MNCNGYASCGCATAQSGCMNTANGFNFGCGTNFIEELINFFVIIIVLESVLGLFCNILP